MTVKDATKQAFILMPDTFHILQLCRKVKAICNRPDLMDGTITRKMRELREKKHIRYEVVEKQHGLYAKNGQLDIFKQK